MKNKLHIFFTFLLTTSILALTSCGESKKKEEKTQQPETETIKVPSFDADSAYKFVEKQVAFGPRVPETKAHLDCKNWLVSELNRHGAETTVQNITVRAYNNNILKGFNIIGSINPDAQTRIMLSAHWDSRPFADWDPEPANHKKPIPGANDGASGVGVLLEIARVLKDNQPPIGVDIFFWDIEDYGEPQDAQGQEKEDTWGLGSQYWSKNPHKPSYKAKYGILLDMVGAHYASFYKEGFSQRFAPEVVSKVWSHANALGYNNYFLNSESNPIMDDHYYINKYANIPTIDIIHQSQNSRTGFYPYWHTMKDDMEQIDKNTLKVVGQTVLRTIFHEK